MYSAPHARAAEIEATRVIWNAHRLDVLTTLAKEPGGFTYTELQYEVVKSSGTNLILQELMKEQLISYDERARRYFSTDLGKRVSAAAEALLKLLRPTGLDNKVARLQAPIDAGQ